MSPGCSLEPRPNGGVLAKAGSVMNISLSINGCSRSKKEIVSRANKIDLYRSSGIQAGTPFVLLTQEEDRRRLCTQGAFIHIQNALVDYEEDTVYQTNFIWKQ